MYIILRDDNLKPNHTVSIINSTTNNVTDIIETLQGFASGIAYNPENKNIYMSDIVDSKSISVIDPSTNKVIKNIPVSDRNYKGDLIYNPTNGYVYATSIINDTGTVSIINSTTNNIIKNIPIGIPSDPFEKRNLLYNPTNGYVYLSGKESGLQVIKHK